MVDLMYCLTNLLFFNIPLLYYINPNSAIICCLFSGDIYLTFGISHSFSSVSELSCEVFVILSAILLPIKSPVASALFELLSLKQFLLNVL